MRSLSDHLRTGHGHAALPFREDRPRCRTERLTGTLPDADILPARTGGALTLPGSG